MRCALLLAVLVWNAVAAQQVNIAAAANLSDVFPAIGSAFEAASKIHPVFSFGSTAQLAQQIENGAPFDLFAAADLSHIDQLIAKNLLVKSSRAVYATGVLALWFPKGAGFRIEDLARPGVRVIAVARPELAPYGEAALETLRRQHLLDQVKAKIVYASNISMARQYGTSGNADAVFCAYSLVLHETGTVIPIPESMHEPIAQALGVIAASANQRAAAAFAAFLQSPKGRIILRKYGYR